MKKLLAILLTFCALAAAAQEYITPVKNDLMPPTPQSWKPVEYQMPQPSMLTGAVDLSIPIYTITAGDYSLPIYMQYHSNGIKVTDDPLPYGYGWTLMPALRATRTIMGRPDEQYPFMSNPTSVEDGLLCVGNQFRFLSGMQPYDSQHDIFTFCLPGKSVTAVLDCTSGTPKFLCPVDEEYRITATAELDEIRVTDPQGITYVFGGWYETQPSSEYRSDTLCTAWALKKIIINSTVAITLDWVTENNQMAGVGLLGGFSFMDCLSPGLWAGVLETEFDNDDGMQANFKDMGVSPKLMHLKTISFPNGSVSFGGNQITVSNGSEVIKQVNFTLNTERTLLKSLNLSDEGVYDFDYNEVKFNNRSSQDWWGYYNGKNNHTLTPKFKVKYIGDNEYKENLDDNSYADRSPDETAMKANILTKVTYPTGGYSKFEYEAHKFNATRAREGMLELAESCNPLLSFGGGIRVRKITTGTGETGDTPVSITYSYSQAVVSAVPSLATFFDIQDVAMVTPGTNTPSTVDFPRSFHINIFSDYLRYDMGATPLWYSSVTAVYPEGKIEYKHQDFVADNHIIKEFGRRFISTLNRVFSTGPQLVAKTIYKLESNTYTKVESETYGYKAFFGSEVIEGTQILRNTISVGERCSPDFVDGNRVENCQSDCTLPFNPYDFKSYTIQPYIERMTSKTKTVFTENGSVKITETYSYKKNTGLIEKVTRTTSDGTDNVITVAYPSASGTDVEKKMVTANAVGKPVSETLTHGSATVKHSADYVQVNGNFALTQTGTTFGASADTLLSPKHSYSWFGRPMTTTDADGISTSWLWGHFGSYLIYKTEGYTIEELVAADGTVMRTPNAQDLQTAPSKGLVSKVLYKKLVGPTSITTPNELTTNYSYYSGDNRLYEVKRGSTLLQRFQYVISHSQENYVQVNDFINDNQVHTVISYYDGLGRENRVEDRATGLRTFKTYDNMGRLARVSVPQVDDPDTYAWTLNGYEASPRNMLIMKTLPGQLWHTQNKSSKTAIYTNTADGAYTCYYLTVNSSDGITMNGKYAAGTLMIEETTDEDGYISRTFTDLEGKVVKTGEGKGTDFYYTYNVYDDYGRLRYVLPPSMGASSYAATSGTLAKFAFIYKYDSRGRLVYTKTPGCAAEEIVYSPAGRVVARHTPAMDAGKWIVYFYDRYGRECIQATATLTDSNISTLGTRFFTAEYTATGSHGGYTISGGFPASLNLLKVTYYDDYQFADGADFDLLSSPRGPAKGLVTGVRDYTARSSGLTTVTIYNFDGFVSAVNSRMLNGKQMRTFTTDRRGKVLSEREVFTASSGKTYVRVTTNTYDKAERLVSSTVVENGKTAKISRQYGDNGLLSREDFGNKLQRTYTYDIHGWLTKSNLSSMSSIVKTNLTSESDEYYSPLAVGGAIVTPPALNVVNLTEQILYTEGATPLYSGCPSAKIMISGGRYDYKFDNHRRLIKADYTSASSKGKDDYSTEYAYDAVANPGYVKRMGVINLTTAGVATYGVLDELGYSYEGNQVTDITQLNQGVDFYGRTGYAPESGTYTWNAAGLLYSDSSRGITSTTYNHLGLPVTQGYKTGPMSTAVNRYTYSADGTLLSIVSLPNSTVRYYSGSRIFNATGLEYSYFPGGYFDSKGNTHYTHTDYQGSIIAVTDSAGTVVQTTNYYPYGEPWREPTGQPMLFAGKERTSLADYHFDPRNYNPAGIFWHAPDLKAGKFTAYSPYSYCCGNPIFLVDRTGLEPSFYESALMSLCAYQEIDKRDYDFAINALENRNWYISDKQVDITFNSTGFFGNGFQSVLFEKRIKGEVKEYAYAIAGTDDIKDMIQDALQLVGASSQYWMAANNSKKLMENPDIQNLGLTIVGQSLGGGCAAAGSMATGCPAITFNAACLSGNTKLFLGLKDSGKITNIVSAVEKFGIKVMVDPLTIVQDLKGMRSDGKRIYLPIKFEGIKSAHSITAAIDAFKK